VYRHGSNLPWNGWILNQSCLFLLHLSICVFLFFRVCPFMCLEHCRCQTTKKVFNCLRWNGVFRNSTNQIEIWARIDYHTPPFGSFFNVFLQLFLQTKSQFKKKHTMQSSPIWTQHSPKWLDFKRNLHFPMSKFTLSSNLFCYKVHYQPNQNYTHIDKFTNNLLEYFSLFETRISFLKVFFWNGKSTFHICDHFDRPFLARKLSRATVTFSVSLQIAAIHNVTKTEHFFIAPHTKTDKHNHKVH
jgi:hypothetical protein